MTGRSLSDIRTSVRGAGREARGFAVLAVARNLPVVTAMARPLRYIPERSVVEVTTRTIQSRFLLRPSAELNDLILGVIGRARSLYDVDVIAFVVMSNHAHFLLSPANGEQLAKFMAHVNRNISDEAGREHDWSGALWARRYRGIVVVDEESQVARLRYLLSNGCKEGLVSSPKSWPGATSVHAIIDGGPVVGTWLDRSGMYRARRRGETVERSEFETSYATVLAPLPCWRRLSAEEYRQRCAEMVADIECETAALNARLGRTVLGVDKILAQDPHGKPRTISKSPAPMVHAATEAARELFVEAYRIFVAAYRRAAAALRAGHGNVEFPAYAFPPARPFILVT